MTVTLETLVLTSQELDACRETVRQMAYFQWEQAGCPEGEGDRFWAEAERTWIERFYVPHRSLDGTRLAQNESATSPGVTAEPAAETLPVKRRRAASAR